PDHLVHEDGSVIFLAWVLGHCQPPGRWYQLKAGGVRGVPIGSGGLAMGQALFFSLVFVDIGLVTGLTVLEVSVLLPQFDVVEDTNDDDLAPGLEAAEVTEIGLDQQTPRLVEVLLVGAGEHRPGEHPRAPVLGSGHHVLGHAGEVLGAVDHQLTVPTLGHDAAFGELTSKGRGQNHPPLLIQRVEVLAEKHCRPSVLTSAPSGRLRHYAPLPPTCQPHYPTTKPPDPHHPTRGSEGQGVAESPRETPGWVGTTAPYLPPHFVRRQGPSPFAIAQGDNPAKLLRSGDPFPLRYRSGGQRGGNDCPLPPASLRSAAGPFPLRYRSGGQTGRAGVAKDQSPTKWG